MAPRTTVAQPTIAHVLQRALLLLTHPETIHADVAAEGTNSGALVTKMHRCRFLALSTIVIKVRKNKSPLSQTRSRMVRRTRRPIIANEGS